MLVFSFLVTGKGIKKLHSGLILLQTLTFKPSTGLEKFHSGVFWKRSGRKFIKVWTFLGKRLDLTNVNKGAFFHEISTFCKISICRRACFYSILLEWMAVSRLSMRVVYLWKADDKMVNNLFCCFVAWIY